VEGDGGRRIEIGFVVRKARGGAHVQAFMRKRRTNG
jgi:hypothetical protein